MEALQLWAALNGHLEVVQFLHRAGCDLDKANSEWLALLEFGAAQNGHLEVVQFLHRAGCDLEQQWLTAMAAWNGHLEVVHFTGLCFDKAGNDGNKWRHGHGGRAISSQGRM